MVKIEPQASVRLRHGSDECHGDARTHLEESAVIIKGLRQATYARGTQVCNRCYWGVLSVVIVGGAGTYACC